MIRPLVRSLGILLGSVVLAALVMIAAILCSVAVVFGGTWIALVGPKRSVFLQLLEQRGRRLTKTE